MNNMLKAGLLSVGTVFFWGLLNVGLRFLVVEYGCHPLALACSNALFCALALIAIGDPKVKILPILRNWNTWFFGLTQILKNICLIYAFVYISSTQTNLLTNIEIVFSLLLTWIFLHRRPNRIDLLAIGFILIGCLVIVAGLPQKIMIAATLWVFGGSLLTALRSIFAEVHPGNKKTSPHANVVRLPDGFCWPAAAPLSCFLYCCLLRLLCCRRKLCRKRLSSSGCRRRPNLFLCPIWSADW